MGLTAGWQESRADEIQMGFKIKILNVLNYTYLGFYFVYYCCNVTTIKKLLELHFSQLVSSKAYFKCKKSIAIFSCQSLLLGTNVPNDN